MAINYSHEEAYIYLPDNRVYHKVGILNKVPFSAEECKLFEGGVLMHNHPSETFSPEDIVFGIKWQLKGMRVITPNKQIIAMISDYKSAFNYDDVVNAYNEGIKNLVTKMNTSNSKVVDSISQDMLYYEITKFLKELGIRYKVKNL